MLFCLFQKSLGNLNNGQYGLTYIVHLEDIDQFLSKPHIGNSDQDTFYLDLSFLYVLLIKIDQCFLNG